MPLYKKRTQIIISNHVIRKQEDWIIVDGEVSRKYFNK